MTKQKIWLDTDIGNDIDDSVALAYLLREPRCQLLGISTVTGEPVERAKLADALCQAAGADIPIFPGIGEPLLTPQRQGHPHQAKYLSRWPHRTQFETGRAIEAMYQAIRQNPGQVTLLAIGPLTNVALLLKTHPDAASMLADIVIMCGEFFGKSTYLRLENEWNAFCDPYAAAIIYATAGVPVRSVGLDVTSQLIMTPDEVQSRFASPLLRVVYDFSGFDTGERQRLYYHDPLAAVSIFAPDVMTYAQGKVSVELAASRTLGRTYFDEDPAGLHQVAASVDRDGFYQAFFAVV